MLTSNRLRNLADRVQPHRLLPRRPAVLPRRRGHHADPRSGGSGDYAFGWSHSPLASYRDEYTLTNEGGRVTPGRSSHTHVGWLSWSFLTLAVAVALFVAAAWLNRRNAINEAT